MKIINFGSLNYDKVYGLKKFVSKGETLLSESYDGFLGGKGLNQSVAASRAGAKVYHFGAVGSDGDALIKCLQDSGVDTTYLKKLDGVSGHAIIQVVNGQNCIIVHGGTNQELTKQDIDTALDNFGKGDLLLLQNEVSNVDYAIRSAHERGLKVALNVSPINDALLSAPLELVDCFLVNEVEAMAVADCDDEDYEVVLTKMKQRYPNAMIVLTLGKKGVLFCKGDERYKYGIYDLPVADTTGAGDTFCGYFIASLAKGLDFEECLRYASVASSISVSRMGAANSIPTFNQVVEFDKINTALPCGI